MRHSIYFFLLYLIIPFRGEAIELAVLTEDFVPYTYESQGKATGFATEIVEVLLKKTGVRIEDSRIKVYPWPRAYDRALNEANVSLFLCPIRPSF